MTTGQISRRECLKLLALTSFAGLGIQRLPDKTGNTIRYQETKLPNIIIVVFDALSAGHISTYGYHRETTPHLSDFAEKSTVYHRHYAAGNFTMPGTASLLTGTYPWANGGYHQFGTIKDEFQAKNLFHLLSEYYFTMAFTRNPIARGLINQFGDAVHQFPNVEEHSIFSSTYSNLLFPNDPNASFWGEKNVRDSFRINLASPFVSSAVNRWINSKVNEESKKLKNLFPRGLPTNLYGQNFILEDAIDWIISAVSMAPQPFFGYFHLFPPHFPYRPRREFIGIFDDGWQPIQKPPHFFTEGRSHEYLSEESRHYDEFIAYADAEFGRFIAELEGKGILENTYLIFTSDHGEMFERGIFKHVTPTLFEPLIHIPLVIHRPHQIQRKDILTLTSCIDIVPTILNITGNPIPEWCQGEILPIDDLETTLNDDRGIFALEAKTNAQRARLTTFTIALVKNFYKMIHYKGYAGYENEYELYDLETDPEELTNIYETNPEIAAALRNDLEQKVSEINLEID